MMQAFAAGVMLALSASANAEFMTSGDLLRRLNDNGATRLFAMGYIVGVSDAIQHASACPPPTLRVGQLVDYIRDGLEAMPPNSWADQSIRALMRARWPCGTL